MDKRGKTFGLQVSIGDYRPRSVVVTDQAPSGNVILRVGREHGYENGGFFILERVVLTPSEARELIAELHAILRGA